MIPRLCHNRFEGLIFEKDGAVKMPSKQTLKTKEEEHMLSQDRVDGFNTVFATGLTHAASRRKQPTTWHCKLPETLVGDYFIIPLTSAKMLKSEGYLMNNCCREYIPLCADSKYSIFSIRSRSGERLVTLGLTNKDDYWRFDQCFGPSNSDVLEETMNYFDEDGMLHTEYFPTEIYYIAHEAVWLMNASEPNH
jgi:hypothetical protein